jgi:hypothetical protein
MLTSSQSYVHQTPALEQAAWTFSQMASHLASASASTLASLQMASTTSGQRDTNRFTPNGLHNISTPTVSTSWALEAVSPTMSIAVFDESETFQAHLRRVYPTHFCGCPPSLWKSRINAHPRELGRPYLMDQLTETTSAL